MARCPNQYTILMNNWAQAICKSLQNSLFALLQIIKMSDKTLFCISLFTYTSGSLELHPGNEPREVFGMFDNDADTAIGKRVGEEAPESKVDNSARDLLNRRACVGSKCKIFQYRDCRLNVAFSSCRNLLRQSLDLSRFSHIASVVRESRGVVYK